MLKRIALALLVLLAATPAQAAITAVARGTCTPSVNTTCTGTAVNAAGANLGVVSLAWYAAGFPDPSISDDSGNGNVWVRRAREQVSPNQSHDIWDCQPCTFTNGMHITAYAGGAVFYGSHAEAFYSGAATSAYGATSAGYFDSNTTIQPGSLTAPGNGYLYVTGVTGVGNPTIAIDSGFTVQSTVPDAPGAGVPMAYGELIQTTAAAVNPTWSNMTYDNHASVMVYWAPASGGGGSVTNHSLGLLGVGK